MNIKDTLWHFSTRVIERFTEPEISLREWTRSLVALLPLVCIVRNHESVTGQPIAHGSNLL